MIVIKYYYKVLLGILLMSILPLSLVIILTIINIIIIINTIFINIIITCIMQYATHHTISAHARMFSASTCWSDILGNYMYIYTHTSSLWNWSQLFKARLVLILG